MARAVGPSAQRQHLYEIADVCCWRIGGAAYEAIGETEYGLPRRILTIADRGALAGQRCTQKCLTRSIRGDRPLRVPELPRQRSEEHTSELQSLMRISYAVFCLKKNIKTRDIYTNDYSHINYQTTHLI